MKLYMHPVSMTSRPVRLFMAEKGLKADEEVIDLMSGAHYQEPYASLNPNKLVPMLEDDGFKLTESSAILKYLADKFDLRRDIQFRSRVTAAHYQEGTRRWDVILEDGRRYTTRLLMTAIGVLSAATMPTRPGRSSGSPPVKRTSSMPSCSTPIRTSRAISSSVSNSTLGSQSRPSGGMQ